MEIKIVDDVRSEMKKDTNKLEKGTAKDRKKIVMTPETFAKVFSPQRIRLLIAIRKNNIKSISDLARQLKRKFEAVHRDIRYLAGLGLIKVVKKEHKAIPILEEHIKMPVVV